MTYISRDTTLDILRTPPGIVRGTFGEGYEAQRAADRYGGQSYSETDRLLESLAPQMDLLRDRYGAAIQAGPQAIHRYLHGWYDDPRRNEQVRRLNPRDRQLLENYESVRDWLARAHADNPKLFRTLEALRDENAKKARALQDHADAVLSTLGGFDSFLAQAAAGIVRDVREPALAALSAVTAPLNAPAIGVSLFGRGLGRVFAERTAETLAEAAGLGLVEGGVAAGSIFLVEAGKRDFYLRQGLTPAEASARIFSETGGAFVAGSVLPPAIFLGGRGVKKLSESVLDRLASRDPRTVAGAAEDVKAAGVQLTREEQADLNLLNEALRTWDEMPPFVPKTREDFLDFYRRAAYAAEVLNTGVVPDDLQRVLRGPNLERYAQKIADLENGHVPTRSEIGRFLDPEEFKVFKAEIKNKIDRSLTDRQRPKTAAQTRVAQAIERAGRLAEEANTPAKDTKAAQARTRALRLFDRLPEEDKAIFELSEGGLPQLRGVERIGREQATRQAALEALGRAVARRLDRGRVDPSIPEGTRTATPEEIREAREQIRDAYRQVNQTPEETLDRVTAGDFEDAIWRDAREDLNAAVRREEPGMDSEDLNALKREFSDLDEDGESLDALSQCVMRANG